VAKALSRHACATVLTTRREANALRCAAEAWAGEAEVGAMGGGVGRRQFLKGGAAALTMVASGTVLAACGEELLEALPFLAQVATSAAEGFGMTVGNAVGSAVTSAVPGFLENGFNAVKDALGSEPAAVVYGYAKSFVENPNRAVVAAIATIDNRPHSQAQLLNGGDPISVPAVVSLGLNRLATKLVQQGLHNVPATSQAKTRAGLQQRYRRELAIANFVWTAGNKSGRVDKHVTYRANTLDDRVIEIDWRPSTTIALQSALTVRRGVALVGQDPQWEPTASFVIPMNSYELWGNQLHS
jgi:hypothetical protein